MFSLLYGMLGSERQKNGSFSSASVVFTATKFTSRPPSGLGGMCLYGCMLAIQLSAGVPGVALFFFISGEAKAGGCGGVGGSNE